MVADIFRQHGFFWARDEKRNPLVGGRKVRYHSFENQVIKDFNRENFGTPLGEMITYNDSQARQFAALVNHEYGGQNGELPPSTSVWKGAVELFPLWWARNSNGNDNLLIEPCIIWRPMQAVMDSLRAKRHGRVDEDKLLSITQARYDTMGRLASDYAFPVIETDKMVHGDLSSLQQAFDHYGYVLDQDMANAIIQPSKWETDR